ncbi:hypothetical protein FDP25_00375 [Roseovarius sp. A21]|uniref:Uncharacterized protein n=2 Tax=Roseovarius bejariae TaxID=2576383 RepID=A0A844CW74_9RHOB|nr:hypothetical protein [Roseovarius bejariae]
MVFALALGLFLPGTGRAQAVLRAPYDDLKQELDARITFDSLPPRPEPGLNFDAPMRLGHTWLGQHFAGQDIENINGFDRVSGLPGAPLALRPGPPGKNLSVAYHQGFESNALFPLGPAGFPALSARGEGALAILFDQGQRAIAFKVHSDYVAPLGGAPRPGDVTLMLYTRQGTLIARLDSPLDPAITKIGLRRTNGLPDIAGVVVLNNDPGGIAIDDILYQTAPAAF